MKTGTDKNRRPTFIKAVKRAIAALLACAMILTGAGMVTVAHALPVYDGLGAQPENRTPEEKIALYEALEAKLQEVIDNHDIMNSLSLNDYHGREWYMLRGYSGIDLVNGELVLIPGDGDDWIGLAVEMAGAIKEEFSDYYNGITERMPLIAVRNDDYWEKPLYEADAVGGADPPAAKKDRERAAENCGDAISCAREALDTGDIKTIAKALFAYADALENAADYLQASGWEKINGPIDFDSENVSIALYEAFYSDPSEYENYDDETYGKLSVVLFEVFFQYAHFAELQMMRDYREYLLSLPSLTQEEEDLLALANVYSFGSLADMDMLLYEDLFPAFFGWHADPGAEDVVLWDPSGSWKIEGTAEELRLARYEVLSSRISDLSELVDALLTAEEGIDGHSQSVLDDITELKGHVDDLTADMSDTLAGLTEYFGGNTNVFPYVMTGVEDSLKELYFHFGDPSGAARDQDIVFADLRDASEYAQEAVTQENVKAAERALLGYADAIETIAKYFDASGLTGAHSCIADYEAEFTDTSVFQGLDEYELGFSRGKLLSVYVYYRWLLDYYKALDYHEYLDVFTDLTDEQHEAWAGSFRFSFAYAGEYAEDIFEEIPKVTPFAGYRKKAEEPEEAPVNNSALILDGLRTQTTVEYDAGNNMTSATVVLGGLDISEAAESGEPLLLDLEVPYAETPEEAPPVKIELPEGSDPVRVEIPAEGLSTNTVAVIVNEDGTEEIVKTCVPGENGVVITLTEGATVKVFDNTKTFTDTDPESWYAKAVSFVSAREIMNGMGDGIFDPERIASRAMIAQALFNLEGAKPGETTGLFSDVAEGDWYAAAVSWLVENGIAKGKGETFGADEDISREALVVMLYNYAKFKGFDVSAKADLSAYLDTDDVSDWAEEAMSWAVGAGILKGREDGNLSPKGSATRGQAATVITRFCEFFA